MEKSQFQKYIATYFQPLLLLLTRTINGKTEEAAQMLEQYKYKTMLTPKLAVNMKWETLNIDGRAVMADVVALDARFPLKKRDKIARASGDIPKLGTKRSLNESQMNDIMLLEAQPGNNGAEIARILFDDVKSVTISIWERVEYMFLQALSNDGVYSATDADNVGVEFRVDLQQPDKNKYGVVTPWSDPTAKPIDDITRVIKAAKRYGHTLKVIHMDYSTFTALLSNTQIKRLLAASNGYGSVANDGLADALPTQLETLMRTQFQLIVNVIDRQFIFETNGVDTVVEGWVENKVVLTPSMNVGSLVYTRLAAEMNPNKAVDYGKVDEYTLVSKYQLLDDTPLELTTSQARALPVVNMFNIYSINTEEATIAEQTEGDTTIELYGDNTVVKADAINALKALGVKINANASDATVQQKVNELNDEDEAAFKTAMGL